MSHITPELLSLHLISEGEKLHSEILKGNGDRMYLIRVGIRIFRYRSVNDWGDRELIYQTDNFKVQIFTRWKWFFRYLAAKEQIKTPKQLVQLQFYSYVAPDKNKVLLTVLTNKLTAAKRDYTKMKIIIENGKDNSTLLFIESDPNYLKALKKLDEKKALINELETEIKSLKL